MRKMGLSERKATVLAGLSRSAFRRPIKGETATDTDAGLRAWLRAYAKAHPQWSYRHAYIDARPEGWAVNHKKVQRLWREEGLRVPAKRRRKRVAPPLPRRRQPAHRTQCGRWISSSTPMRPGVRTIKIASIVDEHTREFLGGIVARSITGADRTSHLNAIAAQQ
jgi:putative transposase